MDTLQKITFTDEDMAKARQSHKILSKVVQENESLTVRLSDSDEIIELPANVVDALIHILDGMASGQQFHVMPLDEELTTAQAAEILNVSRPYVIKLLENGDIPYHKVGTHRRVRLVDLHHYKQEIDVKRREVLDEIVAESQELGLYD